METKLSRALSKSTENGILDHRTDSPLQLGSKKHAQRKGEGEMEQSKTYLLCYLSLIKAQIPSLFSSPNHPGTE